MFRKIFFSPLSSFHELFNVRFSFFSPSYVRISSFTIDNEVKNVRKRRIFHFSSIVCIFVANLIMNHKSTNKVTKIKEKWIRNILERYIKNARDRKEDLFKVHHHPLSLSSFRISISKHRLI